ncbi:MAG TPA: glycosyltransferase [Bacteroidia bacterium]|nr:glycosyltransferase [Bacteroidia bacterium]
MNNSAEQKKIKVLFLARWYPNETNIQLGVFIQKHAVAASRYCDVALLNIVSHDQLKEKFKITCSETAGFPVIIVYHRKIKSGIFPFNKILSFIRYLSAHRKGMNLARQKFGDHHITHAYIFIRPVVLAWCMKIFSRKPFVISEQWSGYVSGKFEKKNLFEKFLVKFLAAKASAVITVSEFLKKGMLRNSIKGNFYVVPNVIETDSKPLSVKNNDGLIKILSVADLVDEIKNISGTIKAVAETVKNYPQVRLDIVGGGHDRQKLEQLAVELSLLDKNVFFRGMKTNEEVYQYLHQCNFIIMNSRFETFSSICAEAMSCGKPVIATRCGGPEEFVTPLTGILIEPDNQKQLEGAIKNMIENYSSYDEQQIKKYATEKFNADAIGKHFFEIYTSILS